MYDYSSDEADEPEYVPISLQECGKCGRKFNSEALSRHQRICDKVNKPRKKFDSSKQRLEEFKDALIKTKTSAPAPKYSSKGSPHKEIKPKKKDFRQQHEEFIKTIRAARRATHAQKTGGKLPPPPSPTFNPDYIQCQYCNRRFAESAAERHINFCKEQKSRLPKQPSDSKYSQKSEKQKIRTQYRPPLPGQKKKSVDSANSPAKPRGYSSSPGSKPGSSPSGSRGTIPQLEKKTKSDNSMSRRTAEKINHDDKPLANNSRYKTNYGSGSDTEKPRSGRNKNGDPKWFEDLKRQGSGVKHNLDDETDSGMDLNDNFNGRYGSGNKKYNHNPVGVVRPSSRPHENNDLYEEREVSAGRRKKMANFCHECGTKYPVTNAKFCCECGIRRMALT